MTQTSQSAQERRKYHRSLGIIAEKAALKSVCRSGCQAPMCGFIVETMETETILSKGSKEELSVRLYFDFALSVLF